MLTWSTHRYRAALIALALLGLLLPLAWPSSPFRLITPASAQSTALYVSPGGNDANPGTEAQPFKTIVKAVNSAGPGQTIYLRAGSYSEVVRVRCSGTAAQPITIRSYPGEWAVLDGKGALPGGTGYGPLMQVSGDYVIVSDFEIANSRSMGLILDGDHNVARRLKVHHGGDNGIFVAGASTGNVVEDSEIFSNCMNNENGKNTTYASGLSAARHPKQAILRRNRVYNNWGEGVSAYEAEHVTIEGNIVYDNYGTNIYIDNAPYTIVQGNLVYRSSKWPWLRSPCIGFSDEDYGHAPTTHDVKIINNLIMGGKRGFFAWQVLPESGLKNWIIANNTFVNADAEALLQIQDAKHENTWIENNVFLQENTIAIAYTSTSKELHFRNNVWSKTPPAVNMGTGSIVADPLLAKTGSIEPGKLTADWFKLLPGSPAINFAVAIPDVTVDFTGAIRGSSPDAGAWEYGVSAPGPTPPGNTPIPWEPTHWLSIPYVLKP